MEKNFIYKVITGWAWDRAGEWGKIKRHLRSLIAEPKIKSSNRPGPGLVICVYTHTEAFIYTSVYTQGSGIGLAALSAGLSRVSFPQW